MQFPCLTYEIEARYLAWKTGMLTGELSLVAEFHTIFLKAPLASLFMLLVAESDVDFK